VVKATSTGALRRSLARRGYALFGLGERVCRARMKASRLKNNGGILNARPNLELWEIMPRLGRLSQVGFSDGPQAIGNADG
jgi:hypothetical protein